MFDFEWEKSVTNSLSSLGKCTGDKGEATFGNKKRDGVGAEGGSRGPKDRVHIRISP